MSKFCINSFREPSKENHIVYGWIWNSHITRESVDRQLTEYAACGIRGIYILPEPADFRPEQMRTFLFPEYLSEDFFEMVEYAIQKAKALGMECWLYDEGGWPSGGACGNTVRENPEAVETVIRTNEVILKTGDIYCPKEEIFPFIGTVRITEAFCAEEETVVTEYFFKKLDTPSLNHVDTTNPDVVDTFIGNTYEAYYKYLNYMFGKEITLFFTDEPSVIYSLIPKNLVETFITEYGYDVTDFLPVILDASLAQTEKQKQARIDYGRLVGQLFYKNYCKKLSDWCNDHNIRFGGHLDLDHIPDGGAHQMYFSHVHALSAFTVPGIDVIWQQIRYPHKNTVPVAEGSPFFPRIAPSAARQSGKKLALTETFGVYGDGLTPDEMRYILNYQAIRGINIFNIFSLTSTDERLGAMVERPVFTPKKPGFYNMTGFHTYYARLSYLLRLGDVVCDTALYHPSADFWANPQICVDACKAYNRAGAELEDKNIWFEIVDDYGIESARVTPNGLKIGDAVYKHIKVPECRYMPESVRAKITPYIGDGKPSLAVKNNKLRVMIRKVENGTLWFIFNEGEDIAEETLDIPAKNLYRLKLQSGEICNAKAADISLVCGEIAVFFSSNEAFPCDPQETEYSLEITEFKPIKARQFLLGSSGIDMKEIDLTAVPKHEFSGEITYMAEYTLPNEPQPQERYRLILDGTSVSASAFLNGKKVADFGMSPMIAVISGSELTQKGNLELSVANTAADEILAKCDVINSYPKPEVGPYHAVSFEFEKRRPQLKLGHVRIEKLGKLGMLDNKKHV